MQSQDSNIQVDISHYDFLSYLDWNRWTSYYTQIRLILNKKPKSVLVIGPGDHIVVNILKTNNIVVKTLDIDIKLNPDFCGSVTEASTLIDKKFDVVVCCQVLEHIEFKYFHDTLESLKKISNKSIIISLPYRRASLSFIFFINRIKPIALSLNFPLFFEKLKFKGEHYWEVGTWGFSRCKIKSEIKKNFKLNKTFQVTGNPYHIFYDCEINNN
jgi:hypothetical protein